MSVIRLGSLAKLNCALATKVLTLVFVYEDDAEGKPKEVLLGLKKRGFGCGKWNGFGGKVEPGETIAEGAARELKEECGLQCETKDLLPQGYLLFQMADKELFKVHVFCTRKYSGEVQESEEMQPQWWTVAKGMPFDKMWPDDEFWFPFMFHKDFFYGEFIFAEDDKTILGKQVGTAEPEPLEKMAASVPRPVEG
eukprot:TRINITY_DN114319_c0_g1_i1.p2 TRINITY_DN114319_c0_g1~~TRINITY_DN114319_c0_g1_i1.p2  ORF type:complete len:195 (-),score=12.21 TRINITY_DN114319_c0_g1_i1:819-1403(-)